MSPASACCLRSCRRRPTRSTSLRRLASLQRVPRPPPAELFFRKRLGQLRPADADALARLDLGDEGAGSSSCAGRRRALRARGVTTRKAASLFTGGGPGATLAFSAATPPRTKSLRHRRTVSSRTPNASAMRGLVQPASVSKHGARPIRLAAIARIGQRQQAGALFLARRHRRFSRHAIHLRIGADSESQKTIRWLAKRNLLRCAGPPKGRRTGQSCDAGGCPGHDAEAEAVEQRLLHHPPFAHHLEPQIY